MHSGMIHVLRKIKQNINFLKHNSNLALWLKSYIMVYFHFYTTQALMHTQRHRWISMNRGKRKDTPRERQTEIDVCKPTQTKTDSDPLSSYRTVTGDKRKAICQAATKVNLTSSFMSILWWAMTSVIPSKNYNPLKTSLRSHEADVAYVCLKHII